MWIATGHIGADLSKTFSKKSLEIVLEAEIPAPSTVSVFWKDKTPKTLATSGFSAFYIVFNFRLFFVNVGFLKKSKKPFAQKARGFESLFLRQTKIPPKAVGFLFGIERED